jgi:hypothetical protein
MAIKIKMVDQVFAVLIYEVLTTSYADDIAIIGGKLSTCVDSLFLCSLRNSSMLKDPLNIFKRYLEGAGLIKFVKP